eukprot:CAMPEP_0179009328 /NCGR_PEP_ID=MMETSP0795-20121207/16213_1 /TAXON_ID=88552 /ORGANISM="Amoebophrya sp., Strain Ameob2" /LENGTH=199 /DNA_ID=CAMNT_0020704517 /DNA_START=266 /DNA_END=865 /DNA_ORIENTATION=+
MSARSWASSSEDVAAEQHATHADTPEVVVDGGKMIRHSSTCASKTTIDITPSPPKCRGQPTGANDVGTTHETLSTPFILPHTRPRLRILSFPCGQFGMQEPLDNEGLAKMKAARSIKYDIFEKCKVNGSETHPLFQKLKAAKRGFFGTKSIKWNWTMFLVGTDGTVLQRFGPWDSQDAVRASIAKIFEDDGELKDAGQK